MQILFLLMTDTFGKINIYLKINCTILTCVSKYAFFLYGRTLIVISNTTMQVTWKRVIYISGFPRILFLHVSRPFLLNWENSTHSKLAYVCNISQSYLHLRIILTCRCFHCNWEHQQLDNSGYTKANYTYHVMKIRLHFAIL